MYQDAIYSVQLHCVTSTYIRNDIVFIRPENNFLLKKIGIVCLRIKHGESKRSSIYTKYLINTEAHNSASFKIKIGIVINSKIYSVLGTYKVKSCGTWKLVISFTVLYLEMEIAVQT